MLESSIEDYLVERVKALGGEVRKVKWIGRSKAPDRLVLLPGINEDGRIELSAHVFQAVTPIPPMQVLVEVKRPGGCETFPKNAHERAQEREHARLRRFGMHVVVIDSKQGVDTLLYRREGYV